MLGKRTLKQKCLQMAPESLYSDVIETRLSGSAFQILAAATGKARLPTVGVQLLRSVNLLGASNLHYNYDKTYKTSCKTCTSLAALIGIIKDARNSFWTERNYRYRQKTGKWRCKLRLLPHMRTYFCDLWSTSGKNITGVSTQNPPNRRPSGWAFPRILVQRCPWVHF